MIGGKDGIGIWRRADAIETGIVTVSIGDATMRMAVTIVIAMGDEDTDLHDEIEVSPRAAGIRDAEDMMMARQTGEVIDITVTATAIRIGIGIGKGVIDTGTKTTTAQGIRPRGMTVIGIVIVIVFLVGEMIIGEG